jgi:GT2 family glycosyltransferase
MKKTEIFTIAVLLACYNRKQKTLHFLERLVKQTSFEKHSIDIYLLDDNSSDGTATAVKEKFPQVDILTGPGNLFWARSMRTIWEHAISKKPYDLFCLFNDDVVLFDDALEKLLKAYQQSDNKGTVLIGSTLDPKTNKISYGGNIFRVHPLKNNSYELIEPDESRPVKCEWGNANVLLVDVATVNRIGILPGTYTHFFSDFDYTSTAYRAGLNVLIAPGYYGYCEDDHGVKWLPRNTSLKERIDYLNSPKGLAYREYLFFIKKHYPAGYIKEFIKLWLKTLFPVIWEKFKKSDKK